MKFSGIEGTVLSTSPHGNYIVMQLHSKVVICGTYSNGNLGTRLALRGVASSPSNLLHHPFWNFKLEKSLVAIPLKQQLNRKYIY